MRSAIKFAAAITAVAACAGLVTAGPAQAANCHGTQSFEQWLAEFKREAATQGISPQTIAVLDGVQFDPSVIRRDRGQGVFQQTFLQFAGRMVSAYRLQHGAAHMKRYAAVFASIEKKYGVPAPVITAFWGLESDFGANMGKFNTLNSIATLAYDCRRPAFFRPQLMDALRIIQAGDLDPAEMHGDWAGELGPLMMTASDYYKRAVDFDGDGKRNLIASVPDALASAANLLVSFGWHRGEPWLQEVSVPAELPWEQADVKIKHPRAQWVKWGVRAAHGTLPSDDVQAALLLPMGRFGPAFLAYRNFDAFLGWNSAFVYSTTAAYFATRLAGAPTVGPGRAKVDALAAKDVAELQRLLVARRFAAPDLKIDGKVGENTRGAIKEAQIKTGLPADSYPTAELLQRLRTAR